MLIIHDGCERSQKYQKKHTIVVTNTKINTFFI